MTSNVVYAFVIKTVHTSCEFPASSPVLHTVAGSVESCPRDCQFGDITCLPKAFPFLHYHGKESSFLHTQILC